MLLLTDASRYEPKAIGVAIPYSANPDRPRRNSCHDRRGWHIQQPRLHRDQSEPLARQRLARQSSIPVYGDRGGK